MLRTILFTLLFFVPTAAFAQTVTPSETQLRYNNDGVLRMQANDYEGAVARFQSSLAVGELNITYLNLGRSYFRLGRCLEAKEALDAVETAPKVASPSPAEISAALGNFRKDYEELCTATVVFNCSEPSQVGIGKSKPRLCEGKLEWPVSAGTHEAIRYDVDVTKSVTVGSGESTTVELERPAVVVEKDPEDDKGDGGGTTAPPPELEESTSTKDIFGYFALGSAGVLLGTALVVDLAVVGPSLDRTNEATGAARQSAEEDLESQQNLNKIVIASGAGLAIVGATLLLWPDEEDPNSVWFTPTASEDGVGAAAGFRW